MSYGANACFGGDFDYTIIIAYQTCGCNMTVVHAIQESVAKCP